MYAHPPDQVCFLGRQQAWDSAVSCCHGSDCGNEKLIIAGIVRAIVIKQIATSTSGGCLPAAPGAQINALQNDREADWQEWIVFIPSRKEEGTDGHQCGACRWQLGSRSWKRLRCLLPL